MSNENFRIEDKSNVSMNGKRTKFSLYRRAGDAFVYTGAFTAPGWNADDKKCISAALDNIEAEEQRQQ